MATKTVAHSNAGAATATQVKADRNKLGAAPGLTPEPELKSVAPGNEAGKIAVPVVGERYSVLMRTRVRLTEQLNSVNKGFLEAGEVVKVLECATVDSKLRLRTARGWISATRAKDGCPFLGLAPTAQEQVPLAPNAKALEPEWCVMCS